MNHELLVNNTWPKKDTQLDNCAALHALSPGCNPGTGEMEF